MPELAIPLINEVFRTSYPPDAEIIQLRNEHQTREGRSVTDMYLRMEERLYHLEIQSTSDGSMIIRMIEYDFAIALERTEMKDGKYCIEFPHSGVIFLRGLHKKDNLEMDLKFPDGQTIVYRVPILWLTDYAADKMIEKNLLFLLPYYIMNYEKRKKRLESDKDYLASMLSEYRKIVDYLESTLLDKEKEKTYRDMMELITRIADHILSDSKKARQEIDKIMGGKILKLKSDELIEQGIVKGEAVTLARINTLNKNLLRDDRMDDLARSLNDSVFQKELLKEYAL